ncbi:hypothetical protein Q6257_27740, partial [Klebsiella variicola]
MLTPTKLPLATVASVNTAGNSFTITVPGGTTPVKVNYSTTSGSATQAYQVDRSKDQVTITPQEYVPFLPEAQQAQAEQMLKWEKVLRFAPLTQRDNH